VLKITGSVDEMAWAHAAHATSHHQGIVYVYTAPVRVPFGWAYLREQVRPLSTAQLTAEQKQAMRDLSSFRVFGDVKAYRDALLHLGQRCAPCRSIVHSLFAILEEGVMCGDLLSNIGARPDGTWVMFDGIATRARRENPAGRPATYKGYTIERQEVVVVGDNQGTNAAGYGAGRRDVKRGRKETVYLLTGGPDNISKSCGSLAEAKRYVDDYLGGIVTLLA
jgi:hypothetical protein